MNPQETKVLDLNPPCSIQAFLVAKIARKSLFNEYAEMMDLVLEELIERVSDKVVAELTDETAEEQITKDYAPLLEELKKIAILASDRDIANCSDLNNVISSSYVSVADLAEIVRREIGRVLDDDDSLL